MKNNKLLLSSALLAGSILTFAHVYIKNTQNTTGTNKETSVDNDRETAKGSAQWLFNIQKNP